MQRFYLPEPLSIGMRVVLPPDVAHHLRVLRLSIGDEVTLFNGGGGEFAATLTEIEKKHAVALIKSFSPRDVEPPFSITLAQALPEGAKMDWVIEKAVELGVAGIQPLAAQRSVVRLSEERAKKRHAHWEAIVASASRQCGRNRLLDVAPLVSFNDWIGQPTEQPRILFSLDATQLLSDWAKTHVPQDVTIMIGPEGGFSPQEEAMAQKQGAIALSLGKRVLRTETAGIAAMAALSAVWGEM